MFPIDAHAPLQGLRVLDASRILAGPFCGQMLGDLGAEIIKLEKPGSGDDTRGWGPPFLDDLSAYFISCNRNKQSLTLDMAHPEGNRILHDLLDRCDVLIENFRSDSAQKLNLTPEQLLQRHPRLIICSISGFGRTGPMKEIPGYDFAIQAMSGMMAITGPVEGPPYKIGVALTDILTGLYAGIAILACLRAREKSGHGYAIDLALLDCAIASQVNVAQAYLTSKKVPARQGNAHLQIVPYQLFATKNGWIVLNVGNDSQWQHFCEAGNAPELASDERFQTNTQRVKNRDILIPLVEESMREFTTEEWQTRLREKNVPHALVWNYADLFQQDQIHQRGMKLTVRDPKGNPVDMIGSPFHIAGAELAKMQIPPRLGEHTSEVLERILQLDSKKMEELRNQKVI
jgi:crotonobetainyl-CoA:carnitine CoA-transferase CaiB-like acyl-CoA transferase